MAIYILYYAICFDCEKETSITFLATAICCLSHMLPQYISDRTAHNSYPSELCRIRIAADVSNLSCLTRPRSDGIRLLGNDTIYTCIFLGITPCLPWSRGQPDPAYPQRKQSIQLSQSMKPKLYSLSSEMTNMVMLSALRASFPKHQF